MVVKMEGTSYLCKTDEVGEICVNSGATASQYWGLQGLTNSTFKVQPLQADGSLLGDAEYTRSGLLGFLGPVSCSYFIARNENGRNGARKKFWITSKDFHAGLNSQGRISRS